MNSLFISPNNLKICWTQKTKFFFNLKYSFCHPSDSAARGRRATLPTLDTPLGRMTYYKGLGKVHKGEAVYTLRCYPTNIRRNSAKINKPQSAYWQPEKLKIKKKHTHTQLQPLYNYKHKHTTCRPVCIRTSLLIIRWNLLWNKEITS